MSSNINRPFAEIISERLLDFAHFVAQGALCVGNDTNVNCLAPGDDAPPDMPKLWAISIVTKDLFKANIFIHAVNLLVAVVLFVAEMSRRAHQPQANRIKREIDNGS